MSLDQATNGAQTPSEPIEAPPNSPQALKELIKYLSLPDLDSLYFVTETDLLNYSQLHPLDLPTRVKFQQALRHFQPSSTTTTTKSDSKSTTTPSTATTKSVLAESAMPMLHLKTLKPSSSDSYQPHDSQVESLNAPDNKAWLGRQDQRPIAAYIR
ncbi:hypothetical protein Pmar_PMAR013907 [Perkinsus marinus ATCC 50983]|uniref:Uncharacterized protein n=1 Tax=Perkinsus marinus (strain ATCC 50983 / TXsc) TaxID=423536 RepID=C5KLT5_PERM5|nr:hypothetical protein Pmar_PMAR013907 [Perkinsus marinus ATCC 50983]EER14558.1 hypothetical protein Pmar_PMAR013907 [Perkinsus marinus ATCC 50983]|eukprot:XP_002782763.1 hypothetical protein Pmar_PMAR013907 [Perkinsus marinus ATCC 50983]